MSNPYEDYKDKVVYDYILVGKLPYKLEADPKASEDQEIDAIEEIENNICNLLTNEDLTAMYFTEVALGNVYPGLVSIEDYIEIVFGVSCKDAKEPFTLEDLKYDVQEYMHCLDSNLDGVSVTGVGGNEDPADDTEPTLVFLKQNGDIIVDVLKQPSKLDIENIDKKLVSEGKLNFKKENINKSAVLSDDGMVEIYEENKLVKSSPFSKLGVIRECKAMIQEGYLLVEINQMNDDKLDIPQTKQELEQSIEQVEELQTLKDELEDKVNTLMEESVEDETKFVLAMYTAVNENKEDYEFDVLIKFVADDSYYVADRVDECQLFTRAEADKKLAEYNTEETLTKGNTKLVALTVEEANKLTNKVEEVKTDIPFPSTEETRKILSTDEAKEISLVKLLDPSQIKWIITNIAPLEEVEEGLKLLADMVIYVGEFISIDEYIKQLKEGGNNNA